MNDMAVLIMGMMVVTYLPRFIPFVVMADRKFSPRLEEFFGYIPYAALGALIIPGFLTAIPGHVEVSIMGVITALLIGYWKGGVVKPVLGAILSCTLFISFGF
ncbi:AzlD domain-containing protein [Gottschalkiaceae bacterium SANA]|nr:AzlD domain-containing protein [Gottschalkiaceae bacterium SANA]